MPAQDTQLVALMAESFRLRMLRDLEDQLRCGGFSRIAGIDEAGRGCLAGLVVAAAVIVDPQRMVPGVDDSKRLDAEERSRLAPLIREHSVAAAWASCSAATIDRVNVLEATKLAMKGALDSLKESPDLVLVDAVPLRADHPRLAVVRGDALCYAVACASIVAKYERDQLMVDLDTDYPGYGFSSNKGYAAPQHRRALAELGPTPIHRLTFRSVVPRQLPAGATEL